MNPERVSSDPGVDSTYESRKRKNAANESRGRSLFATLARYRTRHHKPFRSPFETSY